MRFDQDAALGAETTLPIVDVAGLEPGAPGFGRPHLRVLRRARSVLALLREAGVNGQASVAALTGGVLGYRRIEVQVSTGPDTSWAVRFDTSTRGALDGRAAIAVPGIDPDHRLDRTFAGVDLDTDDSRTRVRRSLLGALEAALAPQVWQHTTADLGKGGQVQVSRATSAESESGWMVNVNGPAGYLLISLGRDGQVRRLHQYVGGQWLHAEGAFARFLRVELAESLQVADPSEVLVPFAGRLRTEARRWSGVRGAARHVAARHAA